MSRYPSLLILHDHLAAALATLASAHVIGLISLSGALPQGTRALDPFAGYVIGTALCGLVYALVATLLYRRRLVAGPLYRCGQSRPADAYRTPYEPGTVRLLEGWQYR